MTADELEAWWNNRAREDHAELQRLREENTTLGLLVKDLTDETRALKEALGEALGVWWAYNEGFTPIEEETERIAELRKRFGLEDHDAR